MIQVGQIIIAMLSSQAMRNLKFPGSYHVHSSLRKKLFGPFREETNFAEANSVNLRTLFPFLVVSHQTTSPLWAKSIKSSVIQQTVAQNETSLNPP